MSFLNILQVIGPVVVYGSITTAIVPTVSINPDHLLGMVLYNDPKRDFFTPKFRVMFEDKIAALYQVGENTFAKVSLN